MKRPQRTWAVIGRGWVGWHASGHNVTGSGGTLEGYLAEALHGALVYDASEADEDAFQCFVIRGPMVDPTLPPGAWKKWEGHTTALAMLPGLGGDFATLARGAIEGGTSLDYVAPDVYERLLRECVPGVRLGRVDDSGAIAWGQP